MENISILLGKRIRDIRISNKLSQEKLAELSGLHPTYIGQIERGEKNPTIDSIYKISSGLEMSVSDLIKNISPQNDTETYADKIYNEIIQLSSDKQKKLYQIIKNILNY